MPLRITFDLEDKDLKFFRSQINRAKQVAANLSEDEILAKARDAIGEVRATKVPKFVQERIEKVESLIAMLEDAEWDIDAERKNVLSALAYFADPEDMIADDIPVLGYIDDAIMIELVVRDLTHEIEAYADFVAYKKGAPKGKESRDEWLHAKRRQLFARMRRRRQSRSTGGSRSYRIF